MGASGDLAPLSHLALGMMGEGRMWSPSTGWGQAKDVLKAHGLEALSLAPKEVREGGGGERERKREREGEGGRERETGFKRFERELAFTFKTL